MSAPTTATYFVRAAGVSASGVGFRLIAVVEESYAAPVLGDGALALWRLSGSSGSVAVDETGDLDGSFVGSPSLGAAGLIAGDADTAVAFDGVDDLVAVPDAAGINTGGPYAERTIELWFNADSVSPRQVLFEEGAYGRGLSIYVDAGSLYSGAWNLIDDDGGRPRLVGVRVDTGCGRDDVSRGVGV